MQDYGVRDVERLLGLARATIRSLVAAGFVTPTRGARNAWRFSFRDLIVLRTAQALVKAGIPSRRIGRSLKALRERLPAQVPLSGLSIAAEADRVVVAEGGRRWQADSGQYLLAFHIAPAGRSLSVVDRPASSVDSYIERADALHEAGDLPAAERIYREAIAAYAGEPILHFNLGVLLDDLGRKDEALDAYRSALRCDANFADAHYNAALLFESLGLAREAIRHMAQYRRLVRRS